MKIYLKWFAIPLLIAVLASALYIVDALIGGLFVDGGSFMWVGFAIWTIFYGASIKDRIKGFIGVIVGFVAALLMMSITNSFDLNLGNISISCLIGVFIVNGLVMMLDKTEKLWLNSITGVFAGIFLTFSGLGTSLAPLSEVSDCFIMLAILAVYTILGLICGFFSIYCTGKIKGALAKKEDAQPKATEEK